MNLTIVARALISVLKLKAIRLEENPDRLVSVDVERLYFTFLVSTELRWHSSPAD